MHALRGLTRLYSWDSFTTPLNNYEQSTLWTLLPLVSPVAALFIQLHSSPFFLC